jgi:hypothetical protein
MFLIWYRTQNLLTVGNEGEGEKVGGGGETTRQTVTGQTVGMPSGATRPLTELNTTTRHWSREV